MRGMIFGVPDAVVGTPSGPSTIEFRKDLDLENTGGLSVELSGLGSNILEVW